MNLRAKVKEIIDDGKQKTLLVDIFDDFINEKIIDSYNIHLDSINNTKEIHIAINESIQQVLHWVNNSQQKISEINLTEQDKQIILDNDYIYIPPTLTEIELQEILSEKRTNAQNYLNSLDFSKPINSTVIIKNILTLLGINYKE